MLACRRVVDICYGWMSFQIGVKGNPANKSLEPTLLSRILVRLILPLQHFKSSLVPLRQPQGGSAPPLGGLSNRGRTMRSTTILLLSQTLILLFSVVVILVGWKGRFRDFGFNIPEDLHLSRIVPLALAYGIVATSALLVCAPDGEGNPLMANLSWLEAVILVWVYASVCEEILFRGVVQTTLATRTEWAFNILKTRISLAVLIASTFFVLDHLGPMLLLGADVVATAVIGLFAFAVGITAGYYREQTNSLIPAIIIHMLANVGGALPVIMVGLLH